VPRTHPVDPQALIDRLRDLYGAKVVERLLAVKSDPSSPIRLSGFIGRAGVSRQTRDQQLVFVNGRAIENPVLSAALREGYHTALMRGQYPITFLFLEVDPASVDVNVHPAKREVRFRDPSGVREAVVEGIRRTLESDRADWQQQFRAPVPVPVAPPPNAAGTASPEAVHRELPHLDPGFALRGQRSVEFTPPPQPVIPTQHFDQQSAGALKTSSDFESSRAAAAMRPPQQFQIIGVLNKLYILMENADGLVLVDQHAAHERVLFEELRRRMEEQGVPSQRLLLPQTFDLPPRDAEWVERNVPILQKMGIGIEGFGPNAFKIDSLPVFVSAPDAVQFMQAVIDELKSASQSSSPLRLGEDMIAKTVCRHAVKANDPLRYPELEKLIQDLLACDLPYCCPHGRPTMIQISHAELEKKFGRKA
jgi:DNA mismatch repair protein MutL